MSGFLSRIMINCGECGYTRLARLIPGGRALITRTNHLHLQ